MGYTRDVVKGVSWIGLLRFLTKAVGFVELIILARILAPAQFGAYGIALLALGLLETITETGVNIVLLQENEIDHFVSSAWIVSIFRGILISLVLFLLTPLVSSFFHSPGSKDLLYLISLVPLIRGFINPSIVKFQKHLKFNKSFFYQMSILTLDTFISIIVTYLTKNPIGIVIGLLSGVTLELFLSFIIVKPRPDLSIRPDYVKMIFHRGKWITGASIFEYLFQNIDNITVGRILGAGSLGIYQLAYSVAVVPLIEVGSVFSYVAVPVLVRISDDSRRFKNAFFKILMGTAVIGIPVSSFLILFPKVLVFLLGKKWEATVAVLPILAVLGFIKSITASSNSAFLSVKKQSYTTLITLINIIVLGATIVPFVANFGIVGAGYSSTFAALISLPVVAYLVFKIIRDMKS